MYSDQCPRGESSAVSLPGLPYRLLRIVVVHDDVGVVGRANRGEVELLGGDVALAPAALDGGGG